MQGVRHNGKAQVIYAGTRFTGIDEYIQRLGESAALLLRYGVLHVKFG